MTLTMLLKINTLSIHKFRLFGKILDPKMNFIETMLYYQANGRFAHEQKQLVTGKLTTTIHLSKVYSLPLTLKYDATNSAFLGF